MNLYQINEVISVILDQGLYVDMETGEVIAEDNLDDILSQLQMAELDKLENLALYVKNLEAEAEAIRSEERALQARRKIKEKKAERISAYLLGYMQQTGKKKAETPRCALSLRNSKAVEITNAADFWAYAMEHPELARTKDPEPDKKAIGDCLKLGANVPGAALIERQSLSIK